MNGNAGLLNFICQNSQMGVKTISQLIDIAEQVEPDMQENSFQEVGVCIRTRFFMSL
ncbi:MAG TPA: hypothetical protein GXX14_01770 [Clostridiaceae bacterium]|nr:hypothetical protein [Clostridiaceae bacterium]